MKTRFFPLVTLCGMVASSGLLARAMEANPTQPSDTTASAVPASAAPQFSGRINDVVSLSKSGVDQSIVLAFIKNSPGPFEPSADEIIKMRDMGVSTPVLTAMLQRGAELREEAHSAAVAAVPDQSNANPGQAPVITETPPSTYAGADDSGYATAPASTVTYIGGDYGYPYYPSTYYYSGFYSSPIFYPFPCWFGGVFFPHGRFFPHGCFVRDNFHVHDGFHAGFHAGVDGRFHSSASGFRAGASGFRAGSSGFHTGVAGGFHNGVNGGFHRGVTSGFHAGVSTGFHSGMTAGAGGFHTGVSGFHSAPVTGFHGGTVGGGIRGGSIGGFHGGAVGGGFHGGGMAGGGFHGGMGGGGGFHGGGGGGFRGGGGGHR